jgi:hypothetical protein
MSAQQILESSSSTATNPGELATVIDALIDAERDATVCAGAMMALADASMVPATRAALDCADTSAAASRVLGRTASPDARVIHSVLQAAISAAERSAAECGKHAHHHEHCRLMSETAGRAADACRRALGTYPG